MNHVCVSLTNGNGPMKGPRKTEWGGHLPQCNCSDQVKIAFSALHSTFKVEILLKTSKFRVLLYVPE